MKDLKELEKKYEEMRLEIQRLKEKLETTDKERDIKE